jgi:predicted ABC-type ATPase
MDAGRVMLKRLHELAEKRVNFAFETTLATRSFAPWIAKLKNDGYEFRLHYLWIRSADLAVARVAGRVVLGGHNIPEDTIHRRYGRGLRNFFSVYAPLAEGWRLYDNGGIDGPQIVAECSADGTTDIKDANTWELVQKYR